MQLESVNRYCTLQSERFMEQAWRHVTLRSSLKEPANCRSVPPLGEAQPQRASDLLQSHERRDSTYCRFKRECERLLGQVHDFAATSPNHRPL